MSTSCSMFTSCSMLGSILICGGGKKERLEKAWEILLDQGFTQDNASPDLLTVQKESEKKSIGIAQARKVKDFMRERPFSGKVKAVVVEDAQLLTDEAQNSLLAVLEEPPKFALIILLCNKEGSLLPTVVSRCQKVNLRENSGAGKSSAPLDLADKSYEELFDLAKDLSQRNKDEVIEFLEGILRYDIGIASPATGLGSVPPNDANNVIASEAKRSLIIKTEKVIKELKDANVALKFALEYVLLSHKEIASPAGAGSQ